MFLGCCKQWQYKYMFHDFENSESSIIRVSNLWGVATSISGDFLLLFFESMVLFNFITFHPTTFPQTMFKHILKDYPDFEETRIQMLFWKQIQVLKRNQIVFWQSQHGCNGGRSGVGIYGGNLSWIFTSNGPTLPCLKYTVFSFLMSSFLTHFITQQLKDSYPLGVVVQFDPSINWRYVRVACI